MAERTTQPYAAVPLDQLRVDLQAIDGLLDEAPRLNARLRSVLNPPPRCACPDPIAVIVSTGPVLCQACGRRCG